MNDTHRNVYLRADQLEFYATWRYKPIRLTRDDQTRHAESVTVLRAP